MERIVSETEEATDTEGTVYEQANVANTLLDYPFGRSLS